MFNVLKLGNIKWYHCNNPSQEQLESLVNDFHFHPLDIEDIKATNYRSKVDVYDDYYFLVLHFPYFENNRTFVRTIEVKVFWGEDYIFTVGKTHWLVDNLFKEGSSLEKPNDYFQIGTSDALLYFILEKLVKGSLTLVKSIGENVETISRNMFDMKSEMIIDKMSKTRKNLIVLNTTFKPQLPLFQKFESGEIEGYAEEMEDYWGNILDYYQKVWDLTEDYDELVAGLSKTFDSLITNRTNEVMKMLTLISSIILPLTFITGLYGMNLNLPLSENSNAFWLLILFMFALVFVMIFIFKRRKWM